MRNDSISNDMPVGESPLFHSESGLSPRSGLGAACSAADDLLGRLLSNAEDIISIQDTNGRYFYCQGSPKSRYISNDIIGKRPEEFFDAETAGRIVERIRLVASRGSALRCEDSLVWEGRTLWFDHHLYPLTDAGGRVVAVGTITREITDQLLAEEALRESEERFRGLFEKAPDAVIIAAAETGDIVAANAAAAALLGMPRDEIIGMQYGSLHPAKLEAFVKSQVASQIDQSRAQGTAKTFETFIARAGGGEAPVEISAQLLLIHGRSYLFIVYRDITRRYRIERELRETGRRYHDLLASVNLAAVILNTAGEIVFCNPFLLDLTGWNVEEVLRKNWFDLFVPDDREKAVFTKAVETGEFPVHYENVITTRSGAPRLIRWSNTLLRDLEGAVIGTASIGEDVTDRKKMGEELLKARKLEAVGILAGGIAHDFNNLLMAIMGNISLSRMFLPPEDEANRLLAEAERACDQARELSYRLLTFSRGGDPVRQPVELPELLRDTAKMSLAGSPIMMAFEFDDDLPVVAADANQIKQVICHLATNAREAMPSGGTVTVRARNVVVSDQGEPLLSSGRYVMITVKDTGIGIPKEHLERVFDPYFTTKEMGSQHGRGLGLAICHSIVKKHGGSIAVESVPGTGASFHVYLPLRDGVTDRGAGADRPAAEPRMGKRRILVMDDDDRVRRVTAEMLNSMGYEVETTPDGEAAVASFRTAQEKGAPFDCALLDLTVPGKMGAIETVRKLAEIDPQVCAIITTGYSNDPILSCYSSWGLAGALAKPYSSDQLCSLLSETMKTRPDTGPQQNSGR